MKHLLGDKVEYIQSIQNLDYYLSNKLQLSILWRWFGSFSADIVLAPFTLMNSYAT